MKNKREENESSKKKISNKAIYIGSVLGLIVLFFSIKMGYHSLCYETTDDAQIDGNVIPIRTMVTGYIRQIRFVDNERVKMGDTLVVYDTTSLKAQVVDAQAQVLAAQTELQSCKMQVSASEYNEMMAESNSGSAMDNIYVAKARLWLARQEYCRFQKMNKDGASTEQTLDNMKTTYQVAIAQLAVAKKQFDASTAQVSTNRSQTTIHSIQAKQALAHIKRAQAQLAFAEDQYHHAFILAPCDGIVSKKSVELGQFVPSGMALASMINLSDIWVTANYKETQLDDIKSNQQAVVTVDAYPGLMVKGYVESFCGATGAKFAILPAENATGNFIKVTQRIPVRIKIGKIRGLKEFLPGMNVVVSVKTK